jgi:hypothetical protein
MESKIRHTSLCVRIVSLISISVSTVFLGCSNIQPAPKVPLAGFPTKPKIPLMVALRLTDELRAAKSGRRQMGDEEFTVIPLGENLALNAESLARASFKAVQVVHNNGTNVGGSVDAILTPRFVSSVRVLSTFPVEFEHKIAVVLEWVLTDLDGNIIWLDTITGQGRITDYKAFDFAGNAGRLLESLFSDRFYRAYDSLLSSPEIRKFAESKTKSEPDYSAPGSVPTISPP